MTPRNGHQIPEMLVNPAIMLPVKAGWNTMDLNTL